MGAIILTTAFVVLLTWVLQQLNAASRRDRIEATGLADWLTTETNRKAGPASWFCPILAILPAGGGKQEAVLVQGHEGAAFVAAFHLKGVHTVFSDEAKLRSHIARLNALLSARKAGTVIQCRYAKTIRPGGVEGKIDPQAHPFVKWLMHRQYRHLNRRPTYELNQYLLFSRPAPGKLEYGISHALNQAQAVDWKDKPRVFYRNLFGKNAVHRDRAQHEAALAEFCRDARQFFYHLQRVCPAVWMTDAQVTACVYRELNPGLPVRTALTADGTSARRQLAQTRIEDHGTHLDFGGKAVVSLLHRTNGPKETEGFMLRGLVGDLSALDAEWELLVTLNYVDQAEKKRELENDQGDALVASENAEHGRDLAEDVKVAEITDVILRGELGELHVGMTLALKLKVRYGSESDNPRTRQAALEHLENMQIDAIAACDSLGIGMKPETRDLKTQFRRSVFGALYQDPRYRDFALLSSHAADVLSGLFERRYTFDESEPVLALRTDTNLYFKFDPRHRIHTAATQLVVGKTGSGKSGLKTMMEAAEMAADHTCAVTDVESGGSSRALFEGVGGLVFDINPAEGRVWNPLDHPFIRLKKEPPLAFYEAAATIYGTLVNAGDSERVVLREAVELVVKKRLGTGEPPRTRDLFLFLDTRTTDADTTAWSRGLAKKLKHYCFDPRENKAGPYARLFDQPTHPDFVRKAQHKYFALDFLKKEKFPENISQAFSFLIACRVLDDVELDGSAKSVLWMDEVWDIVKNNEMLRNELLIRFYRVLRKAGFAGGSATHQHVDYLNGRSAGESAAEAGTVITNTAIHWIGEGKHANIGELLNLTGAELRALDHLAGDNGRYKLFLLKCSEDEERTNFVVFEPAPEMYWTIATTPGTDRPVKQELARNAYAECGSWEEAWQFTIDLLARDFPHGIATETEANRYLRKVLHEEAA